MLKAILIVSQQGQATQEVESGESVTHIGSALDNTVCLEPDAGIERYHAVVERRGGDYWLTNLSPRQGTKVNDQPVHGERQLADGDRIMLGAACLIEFYRADASTQSARSYGAPSANGSSLGSEAGYAASSATITASSAVSSNISSRNAARGASTQPVPVSPPPSETTTGGGISSGVKVVAASALVAAVLVTAAAALLFKPFGGGCRPSARIMTPLNGAVMNAATTIRVETDEAQCIRRVSYELDGREVAASTSAPYEAALDPKRLAGFAAGNHVLTATIVTTDGDAIRQSGEVYIALGGTDGKQGVAGTPPPIPTPEDVAPESTHGTSEVTATDVQAMAERLASQISGKSGYVFEREMTARIRALTGDYASSRVAARAARHRRVVVKSFGDQDVKPLLGFVLAMSRSKFDETPGAEGSGIWRVPPVVARNYSSADEASADTATASARQQQRSAEIAAAYMKYLLGVFGMDNFDLAVACYGDPSEEAGALKQRLMTVPAAEWRNFWQLFQRGLLKPEQAERVFRFYAAGIVGENPQRFGVAGDPTLSSLEY
jgi:hypothetical protein